MAKIRFCNLCDRNIAARKKFNWTIFLLLCLTMIGGIFYIIWFIMKGGDACPICGNTSLLPADTKAKIQ
jgi:hypothetical protein